MRGGASGYRLLHPRIFGPDVRDGPQEDVTHALHPAYVRAGEKGAWCVAIPGEPLSPVLPFDGDVEALLTVSHVTLVRRTVVAGGPRPEGIDTGTLVDVVCFDTQGDLDRYRSWKAAQYREAGHWWPT